MDIKSIHSPEAYLEQYLFMQAQHCKQLPLTMLLLSPRHVKTKVRNIPSTSKKPQKLSLKRLIVLCLILRMVHRKLHSLEAVAILFKSLMKSFRYNLQPKRNSLSSILSHQMYRLIIMPCSRQELFYHIGSFHF